MTLRGTRISVPPIGRSGIGWGVALAATGLMAYGIMGTAADRGTVDGLALALGIGALAVVVLRPGLGGIALPVLIFANAGLVLADNYGAPNVVSALAFLALAAMMISPTWRERALQTTPVLLAFVAYIGIRVISAVQAPGPADAAKVLEDGLIGLAIVLVITAVASTQDGLRHTAEVIAICAAGLAALTIVKQVGVGGTWFGFATDNPPTAEQIAASGRAGFRIGGDQSRATGPLADANFWAQALVLAFPLALWSIRRSPTALGRWLAVGAAALILTGVLLTQSRGGAMALIVAASVWLWFQGGRYRLGLVILPVAVVIGVSVTGNTSRFEQLSQLRDPSASTDFKGRLSENIAAFEMWKDNPVLGVGANEFPSNYRAYAADIGLDARAERNAHNSYLQAAAETGTVGFLAFAAMIVTALWCGLRARGRLLADDEVDTAGVAEALIAGFVGYLVAAVLLHQAYPQYLWAWAALLAGCLLLSGYRMRRLLPGGEA